MKKIIIILFIIIFSSCKENNENEKLMYKQLIHYRDELKTNSLAIDQAINFQLEKEKSLKNILKERKRILLEYEKSFEKLKFKERVKIVKLRDSFNNKHKLYLHFDTSNYDNNVSDTIFNRLMEIDFYRIKTSFQSRYLLTRGCI
ncbi:hypothetical protein OD917_20020 [Flavobacterium sp. SH_e]|uniref:hypothetical protein n=1 Tax=Flavobacterium TaxID=237 RepID=UPI0021E38F4F|nr:hypothetical protein [Flavobacterium sp. SH_e]MCV2487231.1 hypothetical protein [Flavobacterium sp. SH_e]